MPIIITELKDLGLGTAFASGIVLAIAIIVPKKPGIILAIANFEPTVL